MTTMISFAAVFCVTSQRQTAFVYDEVLKVFLDYHDHYLSHHRYQYCNHKIIVG